MRSEVIWGAFADELEKVAFRGAGFVARRRGGGLFRPGDLDEMSRAIQETSIQAPIIMLPGTGLGTSIMARANPYTRGGRRNWARAGANIGMKAGLLGLGAAGAVAAGDAAEAGVGPYDIASPFIDLTTRRP